MTDRERIKELRDMLREAEILVGILKRHLKTAESLANRPVDDKPRDRKPEWAD